MLTASSPIQFPATSSPPSSKRPRPTQDGASRPKPKRQGGFLVDDSSDDEDDEAEDQPPLKKLLTKASSSFASQQPATSTESPSETFGSATNDLSLEPNNTTTQNESSVVSQTEPSSLDPLPFYQPIPAFRPGRSYALRTCDGISSNIRERKRNTNPTYESMVAARTKTKEGRAKRGYYGIDINELVDAASKEISEARSQQPSTRNHKNVPLPSVEKPQAFGKKPKKSLLWTEKYRARTFMDLCGDDGTNRMVLRWLKRWDPLVFPGAARKPPVVRRPGIRSRQEEEKPHRKILMLTGPPGLGKTTLAHVCARQAGYEVMEINASDERSSNVVKNRIRTSLGTESVKTVSNKKPGETERPQKVARPACVIVDEVDGVVAGSGGSGDGGFVKALIDLVLLDQKNSSEASAPTMTHRKKKGDDFRLMRPLILICNDVYHPSLKPLRQSGLAEVIHAGKPTVESVVGRLKSVFDKEGIPCEKDAARKICESAWGMTSGVDAKRGAHSGAEGDLRGVMVVGEWVAGRYRAKTSDYSVPLTRQWLDEHVLQDLANGAGGARGLGRGSAKDVVSRIFQEGGGFPKKALDVSKSAAAKNQRHEQPKTQLGFSEYHKKNAIERLQHMINTSGEVDRIMTDIMLEYPNREFNDDLFLTKPNEAYDWLHFHDTCSSRLFQGQEWELAAYLGQPILACHDLFASSTRHAANAGYDKKWGGDEEEEIRVPFTGPRADYEAFEAERHNRDVLQTIQKKLSPMLMRSFRSPEDVAAEFLPYLTRLVSPDVRPVVVGGSGDQKGIASVRKEHEKVMVRRAADVLADVGIELQRGKIESDIPSRAPQWVYRMEPDLDALSAFETAGNTLSAQAPTRYAVRQVLDQEVQLSLARRNNEARQTRFKHGGKYDHVNIGLDKENAEKVAKSSKQLEKEALLKNAGIKKDFFGRVIENKPLQELDANANGGSGSRRNGDGDGVKGEPRKVWVTYHEGMNNAVRKPVSLAEFMRGL